MSNLTLVDDLSALRELYRTGVTKPVSFRKEQLNKLRKSLESYETEFVEALYKDLKKSPEETFGTETGLVYSEIKTTLKNLDQWLEPQEVDTNLVNLASQSKIYRDPLGVVLIIAPWNYPMQLLLLPLVGAIAGGNAVVLKPSELAPATATVIENLIRSTFPAEYVKVIQGDGAEVVPAMMKNFRFDHVFYTGSVSVGKSIYQLAAEKLVPVTLELGGKSPAIVEKDANLDVAARRIVLGKFLNAGQTCIAPDYLLVQNHVREKLVGKMKETIGKFYTANPSASPDYGKIINERRFNTLAGYLQNARVLHGGDSNKSALYIEPTIIEAAHDRSDPLWSDEIFGPILPVIGFDTFEEAKELVELNPNPLAFYLFTNSSKSENRWISGLSFGGGCINNTAWHFANHHLPFGGVGNSGIGSYHGKGSFDTFTRPKPVMKTPTWLDPAIKYPPFKGKLKLLKWLFK